MPTVMDEGKAVLAPNPVPGIYASLVAVGTALAKTGVAKDRVNEMQKFKFRGIDEVMNAVSRVLADNGVALIPQFYDYPDVERVTGKGGTLIYSKVKGVFTFVSAADASAVSVTTFGVAMDSGDKATNKAMSAALKYALLQTFLIPTEGDHDADASSPEPSVAKPDGFEVWFAALVETSDQGTVALKQAWDAGPKAMKEFARLFRDAQWTEAKKWAGAIDRQRAAVDEALPPDEPPAEEPPEVESKSRAKRIAASKAPR